MKVKDLIKKLQVHDPEAQVVVHDADRKYYDYYSVTYAAAKPMEKKGYGYVSKSLGESQAVNAVIIA